MKRKPPPKKVRLTFHHTVVNALQPMVFPANSTILKAEWTTNIGSGAFVVDWMEEEPW